MYYTSSRTKLAHRGGLATPVASLPAAAGLLAEAGITHRGSRFFIGDEIGYVLHKQYNEACPPRCVAGVFFTGGGPAAPKRACSRRRTAFSPLVYPESPRRAIAFF